MVNKVSLLPGQARFRLDQIRLAKRGKRIALWGIGVLSVCFVVVYGVFFLHNSLLSGSEKKIERAKADFRSLGEEVELNQEARYRLKLVSEILASRFNYGTAMRVALDFLPEETVVKGLEFEKGNLLGLKGCLGSYQLMDSFEKEIEKEFPREGEEGISGVRLERLGVEDSNWCFEVEVEVDV